MLHETHFNKDFRTKWHHKPPRHHLYFTSLSILHLTLPIPCPHSFHWISACFGGPRFHSLHFDKLGSRMETKNGLKINFSIIWLYARVSSRYSIIPFSFRLSSPTLMRRRLRENPTFLLVVWVNNWRGNIWIFEYPNWHRSNWLMNLTWVSQFVYFLSRLCFCCIIYFSLHGRDRNWP